MNIIDKAAVLEVMGGDVGEVRGLLRMFFDNARDQAAKLREGLRVDDRDKVATAAHQLAGAAGTCGMIGLSERLRDLEARAPACGAALLAEGVAVVENLLERAETEFREEFGGADAGGRP